MWQALVKHAVVVPLASLTVYWAVPCICGDLAQPALNVACWYFLWRRQPCRVGDLPIVVTNRAQWKLRDLDLDEGLDVGPVEGHQEQLVTLEQYGLVVLLPRHGPSGLLVCKGI